MRADAERKTLFLSYSHEDREFVTKLYHDLVRAGIHVWLDDREVNVGDSLIDQIEKAMSQMRFFGVVLSPRSVQSAWVKTELNAALSRSIADAEVTIIPILRATCEIPFLLRDKYYCDLSTPEDYDQNLRKLIRRCCTTPEDVRAIVEEYFPMFVNNAWRYHHYLVELHSIPGAKLFGIPLAAHNEYYYQDPDNSTFTFQLVTPEGEPCHEVIRIPFWDLRCAEPL